MLSKEIVVQCTYNSQENVPTLPAKLTALDFSSTHARGPAEIPVPQEVNNTRGAPFGFHELISPWFT